MTVYHNGLTIASERFGSDRTGASGWRGGVAKRVPSNSRITGVGAMVVALEPQGFRSRIIG